MIQYKKLLNKMPNQIKAICLKIGNNYWVKTPSGHVDLGELVSFSRLNETVQISLIGDDKNITVSMSDVFTDDTVGIYLTEKYSVR